MKINHIDKYKIKFLRESIILYNERGSIVLIDLGRKHSIISIYSHLSLITFVNDLC
jgi:hypothetical protein